MATNGEAPNLDRAEVPLVVDGRRHVLQITLSRARAMREAIGEDWGQRVHHAILAWEAEPEVWAEALEIATGGTLDRGDLLETWPPPLQVAVLEAWVVVHAAFWRGPPGAAEAEAELERARQADDDPLPRRTSWSTSGPELVRRVWRRASSGLRRLGRSGSGLPGEASARGVTP